ncbi:hypothetical protein DDF84_030915 [Cupriavidus metallidurans]|uniref:Uncharacterized protein n=1 Tax=Cupriavidus metallidurans TaxID=119219 RepID=A0A482J4H6_9BURK|nr:hypothetical protein DDF84_030915 [Cupriavidus metallidurans]
MSRVSARRCGEFLMMALLVRYAVSLARSWDQCFPLATRQCPASGADPSEFPVRYMRGAHATPEESAPTRKARPDAAVWPARGKNRPPTQNYCIEVIPMSWVLMHNFLNLGLKDCIDACDDSNHDDSRSS